MNNDRRKAIAEIREELESLKSRLETIREEEQDAYDNMPESFQDGERGEKATAAIDNLDYAISNFDDLESNLEEAAQ